MGIFMGISVVVCDMCILAMPYGQFYWILDTIIVGAEPPGNGPQLLGLIGYQLVSQLPYWFKREEVIWNVTTSCEMCTGVCCGFALLWLYMMTSSNENIFRVTGHLCGGFTGHRWIPRTNASDAEHWCFLVCTWINGWVNNRAHCDVTVMNIRLCGMCVMHLFIFLRVGSLALGQSQECFVGREVTLKNR